MAGAQPFFLLHPGKAGNRCPHLIRTGARYGAHFTDAALFQRIGNPADHRAEQHLTQHLRAGRAHSFSVSCRQDNRAYLFQIFHRPYSHMNFYFMNTHSMSIILLQFFYVFSSKTAQLFVECYQFRINVKKNVKYIENPRILCYNDSVPIAHLRMGFRVARILHGTATAQ